MTKTKIISILLFCLFITGCASTKYQPPVSYNPTSSGEGKIIAISSDMPAKPKMTTPGASCLLCLAAAAAANSGLTTHTKTLNNDELLTLNTELEEILGASGYEIMQLSEPVNLKKLKKSKDAVGEKDPVRNHSPLKQSLNATHLLVLDLDYVGFVRDYSGYIAVSPPYSLIEGDAYLVNLETNKYEWYLPVYEKNSVGRNWKEGPNYPGLTNSYYQGVASLRDKILSAFSVKYEGPAPVSDIEQNQNAEASLVSQ